MSVMANKDLLSLCALALVVGTFADAERYATARARGVTLSTNVTRVPLPRYRTPSDEDKDLRGAATVVFSAQDLQVPRTPETAALLLLTHDERGGIPRDFSDAALPALRTNDCPKTTEQQRRAWDKECIAARKVMTESGLDLVEEDDSSGSAKRADLKDHGPPDRRRPNRPQVFWADVWAFSLTR